jgi:hypothetical protein
MRNDELWQQRFWDGCDNKVMILSTDHDADIRTQRRPLAAKLSF